MFENSPKSLPQEERELLIQHHALCAEKLRWAQMRMTERLADLAQPGDRIAPPWRDEGVEVETLLERADRRLAYHLTMLVALRSEPGDD